MESKSTRKPEPLLRSYICDIGKGWWAIVFGIILGTLSSSSFLLKLPPTATAVIALLGLAIAPWFAYAKLSKQLTKCKAENENLKRGPPEPLSDRLVRTKSRLKKLLARAMADCGKSARSGRAALPWLRDFRSICQHVLAEHAFYGFQERLDALVEQAEENDPANGMREILTSLERRALPSIDELREDDLRRTATPEQAHAVQKVLLAARLDGIDRQNRGAFKREDAAERWCSDLRAFMEAHLLPAARQLFPVRPSKSARETAPNTYAALQEYAESIQREDVDPDCDPPDSWNGWQARRRRDERASRQHDIPG